MHLSWNQSFNYFAHFLRDYLKVLVVNHTRIHEKYLSHNEWICSASLRKCSVLKTFHGIGHHNGRNHNLLVSSSSKCTVREKIYLKTINLPPKNMASTTEGFHLMFLWFIFLGPVIFHVKVHFTTFSLFDKLLRYLTTGKTLIKWESGKKLNHISSNDFRFKKEIIF